MASVLYVVVVFDADTFVGVWLGTFPCAGTYAWHAYVAEYMGCTGGVVILRAK